MGKYFRDIYLVDHRKSGRPGRDFASLARSVTALFERHLSVSTHVWRLLVVCRPDADLKLHRICGSGLAEVEANLDTCRFVDADERDRNEWTLATIEDACARACEFWGWPHEPFVTAASAVRAANFVNHYVHKKSKWNRSRSLHAVLWCEHDPELFQLTLIVRDRKGVELYRRLLFADMPSEFVFGWELGKVVWIDDRRLEVFDKLGKVTDSVDFYNA